MKNYFQSSKPPPLFSLSLSLSHSFSLSRGTWAISLCKTKVHLFPGRETAVCLSLFSLLVLMVKGSFHIPPYPHTLGCTVKPDALNLFKAARFFFYSCSSYVKNVLKVLSIWFSLQLRVHTRSCSYH